MKPKTFSITIGGDRWRYRALPRSEYEALHGEDSTALTKTEAKRMDFCLEDLSRRNVIHETFHAHCHYLYLGSSEISWEDFEEIIAEMLEEKLDVISRQADQMLKKMLAQKNMEPK